MQKDRSLFYQDFRAALVWSTLKKPDPGLFQFLAAEGRWKIQNADSWVAPRNAIVIFAHSL